MNPLHFGIDLGDIRIWINLGSNAIPLLIETAKVQRVTCTWSWPMYTLSECSLVSIIIIIIIIIIMGGAVAVWVASRPEACRLSQLQGCGFESAPLTSIA